MTRAEILAETLARLEAERFGPPAPAPRPARCDPPEPLTADQVARNRHVLADAVGGDLYAVAFNERSAS